MVMTEEDAKRGARWWSQLEAVLHAWVVASMVSGSLGSQGVVMCLVC